MKKIVQIHRKKPTLAGGLIRTGLLVLMGFLILPAFAQFNQYQNYIHISGQLTNTLTGAPIPGHNIYIFSDSTINNGFGYYAVAKTDANGFYRDTIVTTSTDGIINIHLFDLNNTLHSLDRHYRFVWEDHFLVFADFSIFDPNTTSEFQANFKTLSDPLEDNPLKVIFRDQSIGLQIKSWEWDFGDGNYSEIQDPEHTYDRPGIYMVTLTISSLPPEYEHFKISTIVKQVQVGVGNYYHLGGHVFANYFPIDYGQAYLYTFDERNQLIPLDTAAIDTLGYYYFYALPPGKYITKTRLQAISELYGQFMPTYIGNVYAWDQAKIIDLQKDDWEAHISLLPSVGMTAGKGQIIGQIVYDTSRSAQAIIPAGNIEILLLDDRGYNLTCGLSDIEGYFIFSNIAYDTYQLYPDVTGIPTTPMYVTITEEKPLASDISLVILPGSITFSINEPESAYIENTFLLYPNPVREQASVSISMKKTSRITLLVTDLLGRTVHREDLLLAEGTRHITIPVQELPAGFYQLVIVPEDNMAVSGKFLKFN
ncbi:MAG: T9SS type A sorting domain-containing protein [Bacteroidales bacterium]|nr:T9SS type A sorting domain-containing protein [Bacteroidales bacterium]